MLSLTRLPQTRGCTGLCLDGHLLYAVGFGTLSIYDVKVPANPVLLGSIDGLGGGRQLAICGHYTLITARESGVWIVDVTDPQAPRRLWRYDTVELATGIAVHGNRVYVAQRLYGIEVLELTQDGRLVHLSRCITDEAQSVTVLPDGCAVGDWKTGQLTLLADGPDDTLSVVSQTPLDGYGDGLAVYPERQLAYVATGHHSQHLPAPEGLGHGHGLELFDISDRQHPRHLSTLKFPVWPETLNDYWTVRTDGRTAYCADTHNGFHVVDVADPSHPQLLQTWRLPEEDFGRRPDGTPRRLPDCVSSVAMGAEAVYIAGARTGLWVLTGVHNRLAAVQPPAISSIITAPRERLLPPGLLRLPVTRPETSGLPAVAPVNVRQVSLGSDCLWAAASHHSLQRYRYGDGPLQPDGCLLPGHCVYDVCEKDGRLYVAYDLYNLDIFELANGELTHCLAHFSQPALPIYHLLLSADSRFCAVSGGTGAVTILDITEPAAIRPIFRHCGGGIQYGDFFPEHDLQGLLPVNWHYSGVAWYDLRGETPVLHSHQRQDRVADQIDGIGLFRGQFLLAGWDNGYLLGDAGGLTRHAVDGPQPHGIPTWDGGNTVLFSCRRNGTVQAYDFRDPARAVFLPERSFVIEGTPGRVVFLPNGKAVIPGGHDGLLQER